MRVLGIFSLLVLLYPGLGDAQILTENAGITSPEIPTLRESVILERDTRLSAVRLEHQFLYGINRSLELKLTVPTILDQRVEFPTPGGGASRHLSGLGDTLLQAKKSLYQIDDVLESTRWAVFSRVRIPTGDDDHQQGGLRLPRRLQPGLGSWGLAAGSAYTLIRDRHRFSVAGSYLHSLRHEGFRPGQEVDLNLAYWYRLHPATFQPDLSVVEVRPVIELLSQYRFTSRGTGGSVGDEGWNIALAPGLQVYPLTNLLLEMGIQVPVYQNIDGARGSQRWSAVVAVKLLF